MHLTAGYVTSGREKHLNSQMNPYSPKEKVVFTWSFLGVVSSSAFSWLSFLTCMAVCSRVHTVRDKEI